MQLLQLRGRKPRILGGSGGMPPPQKIFKSRSSEMPLFSSILGTKMSTTDEYFLTSKMTFLNFSTRLDLPQFQGTMC